MFNWLGSPSHPNNPEGAIVSNGELPKDADGLQLNFCKTLACDNFGLSDAKRYVLQHANPKRPAMVCRECGAFPPYLTTVKC